MTCEKLMEMNIFVLNSNTVDFSIIFENLI
jgi:hypothetical protein